MKKTNNFNLKLIALLFVLVATNISVKAQGGSCSNPVVITPTTNPNFQTYNLIGGNSIWVKFTGSLARIDVIEAFHSDINQKIQQIEVYSNCSTLTQTVNLVGAGFLQRHLIVYSTDLVRIVWTMPSTAVNLIFLLVPSTPNSCMPVPDKFAQSSLNYASNLFPGNDYSTPYTGKILVAAHTTLVIDKDIYFDNCEFIMEYGSRIEMLSTLSYYPQLKLVNCYLHGCDLMWEGIRDDYYTQLYMDNCMIEDAYLGVREMGVPLSGARFKIYNSIFNNNLVGMEIKDVWGSSETIQNTIFTSRQIATTPNYFPSVNQLKSNNEGLLLSSPNSPLIAPMAAISRGYCGIYNNYFEGLLLDGGISASNYNLFDRLAFGIISLNSDAHIYNCHFQNMEYASGKPPFSMTGLQQPGLYNSPVLINQGVGIAADGVSGDDNALWVGNGQPSRGCIFKNCASAGISTNALRDKKILMNQFYCDANIIGPPGGNYGIKLMGENFKLAQTNYTMTSQIISNHITNAKHAIASYQAGLSYNFSDLKIYYNTIDGIPGTGIEVAATNTDFQPGLSADNYPIDKTIYNNTILNTQTGIKISNIKVVPGSTNAHLYVNYNTIKLSSLKTATTASIGVNLISCQNVDVVNNVDVSSTYSLTTDATPASAPFHAAFKNINSPNCVVSCNTAHNVEQGYVFEGACLPTVFTNNYMSKCYDGVALNYSGIIGDQGGEQHPSDNYWNPASGSFGNFKTSVYNMSQTLYSTFYVRNVTGYQHPGNEDYSAFFGNYVHFTSVNGPYFQCNTVNNRPANNDEQEIEKLAKDSIYTDAPPESNFLKDKLIYEKMSDDTLFADTASQELRDYYELLKDNNVGKLGESEKLLMDRDFLQAKLLASSITPSNDAEGITKSFVISYCNWLFDPNYIFAQNEIEQLQGIASLCPAVYGDAVTMARTLLKIALCDYTEYENNCEGTNSALRKSAIVKPSKAMINLQTQLLIYPNPTADFVTIKLPTNADGYLTISDLQGRIILETPLLDALTQVDVSPVDNGIYQYTIKTNTGRVRSGKLSIIR